MSLIAHYPFNGNAQDRLGKYSGALKGSVSWVDAKKSQGLSCNGTDAYVDINAAAQYLHGKPAASIALWVKKDAIQYGFLQLSGYANGNGNLYPYQDENTLYLDVFRTNRLGPIYAPSSVLEWHHVVITQEPGRWCYYFNGELVYTTTANATVSTDYLNGEIGRNSSSRYAQGKFDDVRLYDHALSQDEVSSVAKGRALYLPLLGKTYDAEDTVNVLVDSVTYEQDDVLKRPVAVFDGASYIRIERPLGQRQLDQVWAVEALIYRTDVSGQQFLVSGMNNGLKLSHVTSNPRPLMYINSGANDYYEYANPSSMPAGRWLHVLFTFNNATGYKGIYVDGKDVTSGGPTSGVPSGLASAYFDIGDGFKGKMAYLKMYAMSISAEEALRLYQRVSSVDSRGRFSLNRAQLVELSQPESPIADYSVWKDDSSIGSVSGFTGNGSSAKNSRVTDEGPFGEQAVLWQANNTDASSTADGGWNSPTFPIDNTKLYRYSVWLRRKVVGNGSGYWGCGGYGSVNGVINLAGGGPNTNPYFWSGGVSSEWRLYVGFVHPHTHDEGIHSDNGIYNQEGTRLANISDFKWLPETVSSVHRSYLYYSTDTTTIQQFAYPRVDVCDGTEPSLSALLGGADLLWSQKGFPKAMSMSPSLAAFKSVSEIGVAKGLLHYFPLTKDFRDLMSFKEGVPSDVTFDEYGVRFDGSGDVDLGVLDAFGDEWSVMCRYRPSALTQYTHFLSAYNQSDFAFKAGTTANNTRPYFYSSATGSKPFSTSLVVGQDYHIAMTYKDGVLNQYINGVLDNSHNGTIATVPARGYRAGRYSSEHSDGSERDLRVFNRALDGDEVARQSSWSRSQSSLQRTRGELLISGDLCEVD